jgi:hypothetical protein
MVRLSYFVILCVALIAASPALTADYHGTPEQQAACRPDVLRLCGPEIPNVDRITQCLRYYNSYKKLSPSCAAVFAEKKL